MDVNPTAQVAPSTEASGNRYWSWNTPGGFPSPGKVTATEFQKSPGMADPEKARQTVAKIDRDGDGTLSFREFNTVFAKRHAKQAPSKEATETAQPSPK